MQGLGNKVFIHDNSDGLYLARKNHHIKDFVFLDSADGSGPSYMAYGADQEIDFYPTDLEKFQDFARGLNLSATNGNSSSGWVILLSYEAMYFLESVPLTLRKKIIAGWNPELPLVVARHYPQIITIPAASASIEKDKTHKGDIENRNFRPGTIKKLSSPDQYLNSLKNILSDIAQGRYYELNFSQSHEFPYNGDPWFFYEKLRENAGAGMMAYFNHPRFQIASASPEIFFKIENGVISSYPIKGTAPRGVNEKEENEIIKTLLDSKKESAELLMITDLIRNDLGRICQSGSIKVPQLKKHMPLKNYHHLYSEIRGKLEDNVSFQDLLEAVYPGGSITGAPKIQVVEAIRSYEKRIRGFYTGAIGLVMDSGFAEFNILIRSGFFSDGLCEFATGGGIVHDSDPDKEYQECETKLAALLETLKSYEK